MGLISQRDITPLDLKVERNKLFTECDIFNFVYLDELVPVRAAVLMVEPDGVHHLVLDMSGEVGTAAKLDGLRHREGKEGHPDPARAAPRVVKGYKVALVRLLNPLYASVKLVVVVFD